MRVRHDVCTLAVSRTTSMSMLVIVCIFLGDSGTSSSDSPEAASSNPTQATQYTVGRQVGGLVQGLRCCAQTKTRG